MLEEDMNGVFDYRDQEKETVLCNLCGSARFFVLARRSKNKLPVRTCMCRRCGLIYINPRMTKEGYSRYYNDFYRMDRTSIKGKEESDEGTNFEDARKFGRALARRLGTYIAPGLTVDVGSSTGGILYGLREVIPDLDLLGIEPSEKESDFANAAGVKTFHRLFEDFMREPVPKISQIFCVQTFNHLLDPRAFLEWSFDHLKEEGHLILAVKNFRHQVRRAGFIEAGVQIDHPFMFTPDTLKLFVKSAGFTVAYMDADEGKPMKEIVRQREEGLNIHHIRLVARKAKKTAGNSKKLGFWKVRIARLQFFRPFVRAQYLIFYSSRSGKLRRLFRGS